MYKAKAAGRNNYQFFTSDMADGVVDALRIETRLRHAIEAGELSMYFQPQISPDGRAVADRTRVENPVLVVAAVRTAHFGRPANSFRWRLRLRRKSRLCPGASRPSNPRGTRAGREPDASSAPAGAGPAGENHGTGAARSAARRLHGSPAPRLGGSAPPRRRDRADPGWPDAASGPGTPQPT